MYGYKFRTEVREVDLNESNRYWAGYQNDIVFFLSETFIGDVKWIEMSQTWWIIISDKCFVNETSTKFLQRCVILAKANKGKQSRGLFKSTKSVRPFESSEKVKIFLHSQT